MDSQAIVNTMEVLETKPISELVTEATIKVCYVSETPNPNGTVINKEVGKMIAATLPGAPVVGFFDENSGDFVEHSRQIVIKDGNITFKDLTKPYGFVSFEQPWYQDFMENGQVRTYLMCKAYLWTRQYKEASLALNKGQSMELDEDSMSGYYEGDVFVFTQATLDKLCILGDAYAPCFEGAKIMTTYARQYESLAEQVENIIGRRYYVLNGQLTPKPEKITLDYALQLGWNLTDAVYNQLAARGADGKYHVEGIYTENGEIFAILQDNASLEYLRVIITITGEDTVELGTEMTAVTQTWTPKEPTEPTGVEPLGGNTVDANTDPAASLSTPAEPAPAPASEPAPASVAHTYTEGGEPSAEPVVEPAAEPTSEPTDPATTFTATGGASEPAAEPAAEPVTEPTEPVAEPAVEPAAEPTVEPATDPVEPVAEPAAEPAPAVDPVAEPAEPAIDYVAKYSELTAQVETMTQDLAARDSRIGELEQQLAAYAAIEAEAEKQKKNDVVASYASLLTEDEMKPVVEKMAEYSVETLDEKLAVIFSRKQRAAYAAASGLQLNIGAVAPAVEDLPDFMKQAMEFDKQHELTLRA